MMGRTLIDDIRETRKKISEAHDNDTEKLVSHYREMERQTKRIIFKKETEIKQNKVA